MDHSAGTAIISWRLRFLQYLANPGSLFRPIFIALLLCSPSLWLGWFGDDHYQRARFVAPELMPAKTDLSLYGLFTVSDGTAKNIDALVSHGLLPWYAQNDFRFQPWRPLAELTHALDYSLWPNSAFMMHAQQLLWIFLFFYSVLKFYHYLFQNNIPLLTLALIWVVFDGNLAQTHAWLAGRNTLISASFAVFSLHYYVKSRQALNWRNYVFSIFSYAVALFSSELALGIMAFLFSWAVFCERGFIKRFMFLAPYAGVSLFWLLAYQYGKQGVAGSDWYFDPIKDAAEFLQALTYRYPRALFQQLFILPLEIFGKVALASPAWYIGLIVLTAIAWAFRVQFKNPIFRFLTFGALISIIPLCAGPGIPRVLLLSSVGFAPLVADFLLKYWQSAQLTILANRNLVSFAQFRSIASAFLARFLVGTHALSLLLIPLLGVVFSVSDQLNEKNPALHLPVTNADATKQWIMLNSTDPVLAMIYPLVRAGERAILPANWYLTGAGSGATNIYRVADNSIEIESDTAFLASAADYFVRKKTNQFIPNQVLNFSAMQVTLLSITDDGRPKRVRLDFSRPLNDENTLFFACNKGEYIKVSAAELSSVAHFNCGQ